MYVRVRNRNAVRMQGRTSQRQTERSGLAATLLGLSVARSRFVVVLAVGRARAEGSYIYHVQEEGLCLALGLPTISFCARPHSTGRKSFWEVGIAGEWSVVRCRVQPGERVF